MTGQLLAEREIHIWWTLLDRIGDPAVAEQCVAMLSASERERQQRFVFEKGRREYLFSHAMLRSVLSWYAPVAPADWRFADNPYGKPSVDEPAACAGLRFNLSHSHGMAAVAVARGLEVGIDVENVTRQGGSEDIAGRFFAPEEVEQVRAAGPASRKAVFFDFWTLKEAYIKARGMGLSIPLESFAFELHAGRSPAIRFHEGCGDQAEGWQFFQFEPAPGYRIALAAPVPLGLACKVLCREMVFGMDQGK